MTSCNCNFSVYLLLQTCHQLHEQLRIAMKNITHFLRSAPRLVQVVALVWILTAATLLFRCATPDSSLISLDEWTNTLSTNANEWQAFDNQILQKAAQENNHVAYPKENKKNEEGKPDEAKNQIEDVTDKGFFNNIFNNFVNWLVDKAVNSRSIKNMRLSALDSNAVPSAIVTDTVKTT